MTRRALLVLAAVLGIAFAAPGLAAAAGGNYTFDGGTAAERLQVKKALDASSFNWSLVPGQVTVHIAKGLPSSEAVPGQIWLDADLLDAGQLSWGVVQHEYAHQVDFLLLDATDRTFLNQQLGGTTWCDTVPGLAHAAYGCERFASTLAWSYWQSSANVMRPTSAADEAGAVKPAQFKALLAQVIRSR